MKRLIQTIKLRRLKTEEGCHQIFTYVIMKI